MFWKNKRINLYIIFVGYLLSDRGYDVWLANSRGNTYSRKHVYLDPKEPSYWNFSYKRLIRIWKC